MPKLGPSLQYVKDAIADLHGRMTNFDLDSPIYAAYIREINSLLARKDELEVYNVGRIAEVDDVNADIDARLKKVIDQLEDERKQRLAKIEDAYEDKTKHLPPITCSIEREFSTRVGTLKLVAQHMKRYSDDFKTLREEKNFFHAAACSNWCKYVSTSFEGQYDDLINELWLKAELPSDIDYPLTLANIDRIIHLPGYDKHLFVILDPSLRVILTNAGYSKTQDFPYLVIYDPSTHKFSPIPKDTKNGKLFCRKCLFYQPYPHSCDRRRQCLICLRTGDDIECSKPDIESEFAICPKCNTICETEECFRAHQEICPRPVSRIHDDIVELIKSIEA